MAGLKILALPTVVRIHFRENKTRKVIFAFLVLFFSLRILQEPLQGGALSGSSEERAECEGLFFERNKVSEKENPQTRLKRASKRVSSSAFLFYYEPCITFKKD